MATYLFLLLLFACVSTSSSNPSSCGGRCGQGYYRGSLCQCDYECLGLNECCTDFQDLCTSKDSCKGRCGEPFNRGNPCHCDIDCISYNQCCPDYESMCLMEDTALKPRNTGTAAQRIANSCLNIKNKKSAESSNEEMLNEEGIGDELTVPEYESESTPSEGPEISPEGFYTQSNIEEKQQRENSTFHLETEASSLPSPSVTADGSGMLPGDDRCKESATQQPSEEMTSSTKNANIAPTEGLTSVQSTKDPTAESPLSAEPTKGLKTESPISAEPTEGPTSVEPTKHPTTESPTSAEPTESPTSVEQTKHPTTESSKSAEPTEGPTSAAPTESPTSVETTKGLTTESPTNVEPTEGPTIVEPTKGPTTESPTSAEPTVGPTSVEPTKGPTTESPTSAEATEIPTSVEPTKGPATKNPTSAAPTEGPTSAAPTEGPTSAAPTESLTSVEPTQDPSTEGSARAGPTEGPSTQGPTAGPSTEVTTKKSSSFMDPKATSVPKKPLSMPAPVKPTKKPTQPSKETKEPPKDPSGIVPISLEEKPKPLEPKTEENSKTDNLNYQADDYDSNLCSGRPVGGMTTLRNGTIVVFRGHYFWTLDKQRIPDPPQLITRVWGIPSPIDTVYTRCNCQGKTYFFKGKYYWRFENGVMDLGFPKPISQGFGQIGHITAALSIPAYRSRKESVIFFRRGGKAQKYTYQVTPNCGKRPRIPVFTVRMRARRQAAAALGHVITISKTWKEFPTVVTSAVSVPSRVKEGYKYYVFSQSKYYSIKMEREKPVILKPARGPKENSANSFFKCKETEKN